MVISRILTGAEAFLTADLTPEEKALLEELVGRIKDKASNWLENH